MPASYIDDLPVEMLICILAWAIEGRPGCDTQPRKTLALVSRRFHDIINKYPELWATISSKHSDFPLPVVLVRSKDCPLDVTLDYVDNSPYPRHEWIMGPRFEEVYGHLHRWQTAWLRFNSSSMRGEQLLAPAPLLEKLHMEYGCTPYMDRELTINAFNGQASRLTSLTLRMVSIPWDSGMLSGLQVLKLEQIQKAGPKVEDFKSILAASPLLSVLELNKIQFKDRPSTYTPIQLPHLRALDITFIAPDVARHLLQTIVAPSCRHFCFACDLDDTGRLPSYMNIIRPFIPHNILGKSLVDLGKKQNTLCYRVSSPPETQSFLSITFTCRHDSLYAALSALSSTLPTNLLALDTRIDIYEGSTPTALNHLMTADKVMCVTGLGLHVRAVQSMALLSRLSGPQEVVRGQRRWLFPELQEFELNMNGVNPGLLTRMVKARLGLVRDISSGNVGLPLPFTSIHIHSAAAGHGLDRGMVRVLVRPGVLTWDWAVGENPANE